MAVIELTKENFEQVVTENDFVIVDYWFGFVLVSKLVRQIHKGSFLLRLLENNSKH